MNWPGMGDPTKRRKTLRFLGITAIIAISVGLASSLIQGQLSLDDPLKVCINDKETPFKISATLEIYIDKEITHIPANIGFKEGDCQRSMYTLANDGTIYAEWTEEYPFEIGHFLWMWEFPLKDMEQSKSRVLVDGIVSDKFINHPLQEGAAYKAEFFTKDYEAGKFIPPDALN